MKLPFAARHLLSLLGVVTITPAFAQITETQITTATSDQRPAWSPTSPVIVFDSNRSGNLDLWSVPVTGGTPTKLTANTNVDQHPDFSPSGSVIVFAAAVGGGGSIDLYTRPAAGGGSTLLHADPTTVEGFPSWSPDSTKIAFTKGTDIYIIPSSGGVPVQLTTDPATDTHPSWSPDGAQIAFQSTRSGNNDIWVMPSTGGTATQLTTDPGADGAPDWSPDGATIAFQSNRAGNNDIWLVPAGGGTETQITIHTGNDVQPDWSPDGLSIVFARNGSLFIASFPVSDLAVTKVVDDPAPSEGGTVVYTVTVSNGGPNAATGVELTDLLPAGVTYVSDVPSQGTYTSGTGLWVVGSLANAASATLDIAATVDLGTSGATLTNTASVTASDQADP
ncbi:MAG: hypothetical protein ACT4PE_17910, partial [Candidatus Eiseniibacteriota bacterium]